MNITKKSKGFTLIELMIVVAIIGILAAVAIPKFADLVTKSKEAGIKGNLGAVRSALSIYYGDSEGVYPQNMFAALTTANKYMPAVGGANSLGNFDIPSNRYNNGHVYGNLSAASLVKQVSTVTPTDTTGPLLYIMWSTANNGEVYINCTHKDTKANQWTTY